MSWLELQCRFREIVIQAEGPGKSTSGELSVTYDFNGEISVTMGTYDIGHWPRETFLGPFKTEEEAIKATIAKLDEAADVVEKELAENTISDSNDSDDLWSEEPEDIYTVPGLGKVTVTASEDPVCVCNGKCICGLRFSYGLE